MPKSSFGQITAKVSYDNGPSHTPLALNTAHTDDLFLSPTSSTQLLGFTRLSIRPSSL